MKRITKILLCVLCAVAAVLCVAAACFMLLKKQSGTTASSAASGASVSTYGKVSDFDYASFDYSEGLDDNGHWTGIRALDYVTLPEDVSALEIIPGRDLCTLVTCTPYGINTHRLLVRGNRVPYTPEQASAAEEKPVASSWTQHYLTGLAIGLGVVAVIGGGYALIRRKRHA